MELVVKKIPREAEEVRNFLMNLGVVNKQKGGWMDTERFANSCRWLKSHCSTCHVEEERPAKKPKRWHEAVCEAGEILQIIEVDEQIPQ